MAAEVTSSRAAPYEWDTTASPPEDVLSLWASVGIKLEEEEFVMRKLVVDSLGNALEHLEKSEDARSFIETYAGRVVILVAGQSPENVASEERYCVTKSLYLSCEIVAKDIGIQLQRGGFCKLIDSVLVHVFSRTAPFYKRNVDQVRLECIEFFRSLGGFTKLNRYMLARIDTPDAVDGPFPSLVEIQVLLSATLDSLGGKEVSQTPKEDDALAITKTVILYLRLQQHDVSLKAFPLGVLSSVLKELQRIFDRLASSRRDDMLQFYAFWRDLVLYMIRSPSLTLNLTGWEQMNELIASAARHRPPARSFTVSGAGCLFVNGTYEYIGEITPDGYTEPGSDAIYVYVVPDGSPHAGKKLTLFRCVTRSKKRWWFLSEADEDQPGTDRDIDYYRHKGGELAFPPPMGWTTAAIGIDPPPRFQPDGLLVPPGEDMNTLEHKLAQWAIENEIVEQVLGDTTIHREVVNRSTELIKFLASMCNRDPEPTHESAMMSAAQTTAPDETVTDTQPNRYCLQTSHLLLAWKTCTRKSDAAFSHQMHQLLVLVLPLCTSNRAIPLLSAIQTSLQESSDKPEYLCEVVEFLSVLGGSYKSPEFALSEGVQHEVLNFFCSIRVYKRRVRESCVAAMSENSKPRPVDLMLDMLFKFYESNELFLEGLACKLLTARDDMDQERHALELLKRRYGETSDCLHSASVMIKDIDDSVRRHESFPDTVVEPVIVSHIFWPSLSNDPLKHHPRIQALLDRYGGVYAQQTNPRQLRWLHCLGTVTLDVTVDGTTKEINCSPLQATLLSHFEDVQCWSLSALSNETGVTESVLEENISFWIKHGLVLVDDERSYHLTSPRTPTANTTRRKTNSGFRDKSLPS